MVMLHPLKGVWLHSGHIFVRLSPDVDGILLWAGHCWGGGEEPPCHGAMVVISAAKVRKECIAGDWSW